MKRLPRAAFLLLLGGSTFARGGGEVDWHAGTWSEVLATAQEREDVIFVDFWADWCHWCKELDKRTFTDEAALRVLSEMVTYSVDVESEAGKEISDRYSSGAMPLPTLLFLDSDGTPREAIQGFLPPEAFVTEAQRILRDEGTIGDLRRRLAADEKDHAARWELATKLDTVGDGDGSEKQLARLQELDPQGRSLPLRRLALEEILQGIGPELDTQPLREFLAAEEHDENRFRGWFFVGRVEEHRARAAEEGGEVDASALYAAALAARRLAWSYVPEQFVVIAGKEIATSIHTRRDALTDADLAFAVEVMKQVAQVAPDDETVGTLLRDALGDFQTRSIPGDE